METIGNFIGSIMIPFLIILLFVAILVAARVVASRYKKIPPNAVGIFYGRKYTYIGAEGKPEKIGFKVVAGGGRVLLPFVENYQEMSTSAFQVEIDETGIPNKDNVKMEVKGVATCKISTLAEDLHNAAQAFLGKDAHEVNLFIQNILKGHLRSIIGKLDIGSLLRERDQFNKSVIAESASELKRLGVQIITLVIQELSDQHGYIDALGKRAVAEAVRDANIKVAEANRDSAIKVSDAEREAATVKAQNEAKIAEANKERDVKIAQMAVLTNTEQAKAERAKEIQLADQDRILKVKQAERDAAEKEAQITVQMREAERKQKELEATVVKPAEAAKQKQVIDAEAAKQKRLIEAEAAAQAVQREAEGKKEADIMLGVGEASRIQAVRTAEAAGEQAKLVAAAEGHKQQLLAEAAGKKADAEATQAQAEALKLLDERGTMVLILRAAPELIDRGGEAMSKIMESVFRSAAAPFGSVDKITITDFGSDGQALKNFGSIVPDFVANVLKRFATMGIDPKPLLTKLGLDVDRFLALIGKTGEQPAPPDAK
jgi:flotillin